MEFYKEYITKKEYIAKGVINTTRVITASDQLNEDVKANPQWKSEVQGYASEDDCTLILVRWVGLSKTPFKESE